MQRRLLSWLGARGSLLVLVRWTRLALCAFGSCALATSAYAGQRGWDRPTPRVRAKAALRQVLRETAAAARRGERPVALFDLDDTSIDARPRLKEAARRVGLPTRGVTSAKALYAGLAEAARVEKRTAFGKVYFDDASLLSLDRPQKGVRRFVREFIRAGGRPLFASGRWESTRDTTEAQLEHLRIPLRASRDLLLNPGPELKAREWKLKVPKLVEKRGRLMAAFENEATSIAGYRRAFPKARMFRLGTMRFDEAPDEPLRDVLVLRDFGY